MNLYRLTILAALIFALGCSGGPATTTAPKASSHSEFRKLCRALGAEGDKLQREKFIAAAKDKEAAAKLFDACDTQKKGYLVEEDVPPAYMNRLKNEAIRLTNP